MKCRRCLILIVFLFGVTHTSLPAQTVKFQYSQSLIFVPVKVNGLNLLFLLNTGANTTVLDKRIGDKLGLPVIKETDTVTGTAGKQAVAIVKTKTLTIGSFVFKDLQVSQRDLGSFIYLNNQKVDGILGTDVLKQFALTIDYKKQVITLQKAIVPAGKKKTIGFEMPEGIPRVEMRINDTFNTFVHLNTGVSLIPGKDVYVNVSHRQWEQLKSINPNLLHSKYLTGKGVGGGIYLQAVRVNKIELNHSITIYDGYIIIQPREGYFKDDNAIGFFGNNLLEKYNKVTIDFPGRQVIFPINKPAVAQKKKVAKRR